MPDFYARVQRASLEALVGTCIVFPLDCVGIQGRFAPAGQFGDWKDALQGALTPVIKKDGGS